MESARSYLAFEATYRRFEITDYTGAISNGTENAGQEAASEENPEGKAITQSEAGKEDSIQAWISRMQAARSNFHVRTASATTAETIRQETIAYIFEILFGSRSKTLTERLQEVMGRDDSESGCEGADGQTFYVQPARVMQYTEQTHRYEQETTAFSTTGKVRTADGREIDFNVNLKMSRQFEEYGEKYLGMQYVQTLDPLVINLNGSVGQVSDQTFYFDLDCDGEEDKIARLCEGSGFLALDRDGNGTIDDGSELFGTASGDGFGDLAEFDADGNGWIDENDEVWNRLKVWMKDENGKDILYTLREAGVGAISLSHVETDFAIRDENNRDRAQVRSSGVYLYEDGRAGTIQQIDLVKFAKEA
jgi:hypothetical protein